jgi:hypothetical protein
MNLKGMSPVKYRTQKMLLVFTETAISPNRSYIAAFFMSENL